MDKKNLSEEDIKRLYITPHIEKKWDREHIRMEMKITDGRVNIRGNMAFREKLKKADYVLLLVPYTLPLGRKLCRRFFLHNTVHGSHRPFGIFKIYIAHPGDFSRAG